MLDMLHGFAHGDKGGKVCWIYVVWYCLMLDVLHGFVHGDKGGKVSAMSLSLLHGVLLFCCILHIEPGTRWLILIVFCKIL